MTLNTNQDLLSRIHELKEKLPNNWVNQFLDICEHQLKRRYVRQTAYKILNEGQVHHDGWKVIEGIARRHQEALEKVA